MDEGRRDATLDRMEIRPSTHFAEHESALREGGKRYRPGKVNVRPYATERRNRVGDGNPRPARVPEQLKLDLCRGHYACPRF